jgi:hypothetical protein
MVPLRKGVEFYRASNTNSRVRSDVEGAVFNKCLKDALHKESKSKYTYKIVRGESCISFLCRAEAWILLCLTGSIWNGQGEDVRKLWTNILRGFLTNNLASGHEHIALLLLFFASSKCGAYHCGFKLTKHILGPYVYCWLLHHRFIRLYTSVYGAST